MIFHDYYSDIPRAEVDRFVRSQELARLVTVGDDAIPHVGLYPFIYDGNSADLHLVRSDEQIKDLKARLPRGAGSDRRREPRDHALVREFKLGQNRPADARRRVIAELRKRGRPSDGRAAEALQWDDRFVRGTARGRGTEG